MTSVLQYKWQAYKPKVFKAPDGTEFATRRQVFKYWFNFTDREGETLVRSYF